MPSFRVRGHRLNVRTGAAVGGGGGARTVLAPADFTYLGSFRPPPSAGPGAYGTAYSKGAIACRRVAGETRLFLSSYTGSSAGSGMVYEVTPPSPIAPPANPLSLSSYTPATFRTWWGDVTNGKRINSQAPDATAAIGVNNWLLGLAWDEAAGRLYWSNCWSYSAAATDPSFGFSVLDDVTTTATAYGPFAVLTADGTCRAARTSQGIMLIPQAFADANCSGRTVGCGLGGIISATGSHWSMGPALFAVAPPPTSQTPWASTSAPNAVASTSLLDYGNTQGQGLAPTPARRGTDYANEVVNTVAGGTASSIYVEVGLGTSVNTTQDANGGRFYRPGFGSHDLTYVPGPVIITFPDATTQTRGVTSYTIDGSGNWVLTLDSPLSGGKTVTSACTIRLHSTATGSVQNPAPWEVSGGTGYWTWLDSVRGGGVWIDGTAKHGVCFFPRMGSGAMWYPPAGTRTESLRTELWIYDPADLAAVAGGLPAATCAVNPAYRTLFNQPGMGTPEVVNSSAVTNGYIISAAFEPTTKILYLFQGFTLFNAGWSALIHAYAVDC